MTLQKYTLYVLTTRNSRHEQLENLDKAEKKKKNILNYDVLYGIKHERRSKRKFSLSLWSQVYLSSDAWYQLPKLNETWTTTLTLQPRLFFLYT